MGVIPTIGPFVLPRVLPGLRRAYDQLKLYLVEDLTVRLIEALHQGKLDVVLLALPYECGAVEIEVLFEDPFVVALPRGHILAKEARLKSCGAKICCCSKMVIACAITRSLPAGSPIDAIPKHSRGQACPPLCKWSTMGLARRYCRRLLSMLGCCVVPAS
jgi:DNA-binding transcriptional LysR family regulator